MSPTTVRKAEQDEGHLRGATIRALEQYIAEP